LGNPKEYQKSTTFPFLGHKKGRSPKIENRPRSVALGKPQP